jgi:type I restriction enzyme, R subunit
VISFLNTEKLGRFLGDDGSGNEEIVAPIEERVQLLIEGINATEAHLRGNATEALLRGLGFDPATLIGSNGFARIKGVADAVEAVYRATRPSGGSR